MYISSNILSFLFSDNCDGKSLQNSTATTRSRKNSAFFFRTKAGSHSTQPPYTVSVPVHSTSEYSSVSEMSDRFQIFGQLVSLSVRPSVGRVISFNIWSVVSWNEVKSLFLGIEVITSHDDFIDSKYVCNFYVISYKIVGRVSCLLWYVQYYSSNFDGAAV